jgi:hypothetical protein
MKPDFVTMTTQELRNYIFEHRDDEDAVHEMVLRIEKEGKPLNSIEELEEVVKQKREQRQQT